MNTIPHKSYKKNICSLQRGAMEKLIQIENICTKLHRSFQDFSCYTFFYCEYFGGNLNFNKTNLKKYPINH